MKKTLRRTLLLGTATALLALGAAAVPASASELQPFRATLDEQTSFGPCPAGVPAGLTCAVGTGSGQAAYIGRFTERSANQLDTQHPNPTTGCLTDVSSQLTLTTENGDLVYLTAPGVFCPSGANFSGTEIGTWKITGGTGRFKGVTGSGTFKSSVPFGLTANGTISSSTTFEGTLARTDQ